MYIFREKRLRMTRTLQRVSLRLSIHLGYLHQDTGKRCLEIARMRLYRKYSKATICRHMNKSIGDLAVDKYKEYLGLTPNLV